MRHSLFLFTVLMALTACGPKKQDAITPANKSIPITKATYCGDTLIVTLGMVFKVDAFGGITPVPDGVYTRPSPPCSYLVHQGTITVTEGN